MASRQIKIKPDNTDDEIIFFPDDNLTNKEIEIIRDLLKDNPMQLENYDKYDDEGNPIESEQDWKGVAVDISKIPTKKFSDNIEFPFGDIHRLFVLNDGMDGYFNSYNELSYFAYAYYKGYGKI